MKSCSFFLLVFIISITFLIINSLPLIKFKNRNQKSISSSITSSSSSSSSSSSLLLSSIIISSLSSSLSSLSYEYNRTDIKPNHVAFIVDGNGRWAEERGEPRMQGHISGASNTIDIVKESFKYGINIITLFLFSTENWKRPKPEIDNIMNLLEKYLIEFNSYLIENKIRVEIIGQIYRLPLNIQSLINNVGYKNNNNDNNNEKILVLAISYGGRDDIISTTKRIYEEIKLGKKKIDDINEDYFSCHTSTGKLNIPDPDVIIRTSGESRISNFLLWQLAYSEFISVNKKWPDFHINDCIDLYNNITKRERRYGNVKS